APVAEPEPALAAEAAPEPAPAAPEPWRKPDEFRFGWKEWTGASLMAAFVLAALVVPRSCKRQPPPSFADESGLTGFARCAEGEPRPVEGYAGAMELAPEVVSRVAAAVAFGPRTGCSAVLVDADRLMSAGHCGWRVGDVVDFAYPKPLGEREVDRRPSEWRVAEVLATADAATADYAVLRLDVAEWEEEAPPRTFVPPPEPLEIADAVAGGWVALVGHAQDVLRDAQPEAPSKKVHASALPDAMEPVDGQFFTHYAASRPGTSGAPVVDMEGRVVGIHIVGGCRAGSEGCLADYARCEGGGNFAMTAAAIPLRSAAAAVAARDPEASADEGMEPDAVDDAPSDDTAGEEAATATLGSSGFGGLRLQLQSPSLAFPGGRRPALE
ncbi:MAG: serine protease, partial [Myxococcota bacterium]